MAKEKRVKIEVKPIPAKENGASHVPSYILKRNHGLHVNGRANTFYEAGTTLHSENDKDLILALIRSGAALEESVPPKKKVAPGGEESKTEGEQGQQQDEGQQENGSE